MYYTNAVYYISPYGRKILQTYTYVIHSDTHTTLEVSLKQEKQ